MDKRQLRGLRGERTRRSNLVKREMANMLTATLVPNTTARDGMPTWWPFVSDCLKERVIETVRAARRIADYEGVR